MFLAIRELRFARGRFALMGSVVALIALLMVLLSGLSSGLVNDGVSGLKAQPVTHFAFAHQVDAGNAFSRSTVTDEATRAWRQQPGVREAAPFGNTLVNATTRPGDGSQGVEIDLALFGVEPGSFLDPGAAAGQAIAAGRPGIVISPTAREEGVEVGDTVVLDPLGTELEVVGVLGEQATFGHVDVAYLPLPLWQQVKAGVRPGEQMPERATHEFTAVGLALADDVDLADADQAAGTTTMTREDSYGASPGYSAETMTLNLIQYFLYAISALVVGAFFTVVTIQRKGEIAVSRAMGASTGYLLRDSLLQSLVLLVAAVAVGVGLGLGLGALLQGSPMPFALEAGPVTSASVLLIVLGMIGAGVSVLRITRVDPLTALGGNR